MADDRLGDSPLAYKQWDDKPTWLLDRGRDDHGMHPTDDHLRTGFHAALVSHRVKTAQLTDAAMAFLDFKKTAVSADWIVNSVRSGSQKATPQRVAQFAHRMMDNKTPGHALAARSAVSGLSEKAKIAGLMGAAKSLGGMAVKNPHLAGAAIGAAGGAIAGGPKHRLGGAAIGGALGAGAGHMASKLPAMGAGVAEAPGVGTRLVHQAQQDVGAAAHAAEDKSTAAAVAKLNPNRPATVAPPAASGLANQSPQALSDARQELSGGAGAVRGVGQAPAAGPAPGYSPPPAAQTQLIPTKGFPQQAPATELGRQNLAGFNQHINSMMTGQPSPGPMRTAAGTPQASAQTVAMKKVKQAAWLPPFVVADDSKIAVENGGSSAKTAAVVSELAQIADHGPAGGGFHVPGMGALVGAVDDFANIGRQKLQAMISRRQNRNNQQQHPVTPVGPVKVAMVPLKRALQSAAGWGSAGAVTGAITAKPGRRREGAMIGALAGGAGGAIAPTAEHHVGKLLKLAANPDGSPLMDMRQRAAERFPEKVSPIEAIRTDFKSALHLLQDKFHDLGSIRHDLAQPKLAAAVGLDYKELARLGGMPKQLMNRQGLTTAAAGALIGGGLSYLASRGKKEHGGRSQAEVDYAGAKARQPEHPEGIRKTIGKHVVNMHHDVAEQMRKHPIAATAMGAGAGAGIALKLAPILGIASHLK